MLSGLLIAILVQSLILAALCLTVRRGDVANRWLAVYFLTIAFQRAFHMVLRSTDWLHQHPWLVCSYEVSVLLGVFAVQRFVWQLLGKPAGPVSRGFGVALLLLLGVFAVGFGGGWWAGVELYYHHPYAPHLLSVWVCAYTLWAAWMGLRAIRRALASTAHEPFRVRLSLRATRWLLYYQAFRAVLTLLFVAVRQTALRDLALLSSLEQVYLLVVNVLLIVVLALMAYFALRNPDFFNHFGGETTGVEQQIVLAVMPEQEKQMLHPVLSADEQEEWAARLHHLMVHQQPWLDPKLTPAKLAQQLGLPQYKLGRVLNQGIGQHFSEFVNHYRVAHAQALLNDPAHARDTMYAIALDSGFASEAPFYAAFKKITGHSPAAWRDTAKSS